MVVGLIALFNGTMEEVFWRGITLSEYDESPSLLAASSVLFAVFHFAFLFLPLTYQGGAANLIGGSAVMGVIWLLVTKFTKNLWFALAAHVVVNFFAFTGLFVDNGMLVGLSL